ncbi:conserved hypothetical protein [Gammaproteobacteria bacterium]
MNFHFDPNQVTEIAALINSPNINRKRYPEGVVIAMANETEALQHANPEKNLHPAVVIGPARSSEGVRLYYLVKWLRTDLS